MHSKVEHDGFAFVHAVFSSAEVEILSEVLGPALHAGRRGLLGLPEVKKIAESPELLHLVRPHLSAEPKPVRAIYFNKSPVMNWQVAWHQDLTIAVRNPVEIPGFGPWSIKDGVPHVQPPTDLLKQMLTLRVHLDHADETNGALRVLPGSHLLGRLGASQIQALRRERSEFLCRAHAGDALLMRPLLLHASGRSKRGLSRRVLHIEYAGFQLPSSLEWNDAA